MKIEQEDAEEHERLRLHKIQWDEIVRRNREQDEIEEQERLRYLRIVEQEEAERLRKIKLV